MIGVRGMRRYGVCVLAVVLAGLVVGASSACAGSAWWHLRSGSLPTDLRAGGARDEVLKLTVNATGGQFAMIARSPGHEAFAPVKWDASAQEVREGIEALYGPGTAEVSGAPGEYTIKFIGAEGAQQVTSFVVFPFNLEGGREEAKLVVVTDGRPDGFVVVIADNLGDASTSTCARVAAGKGKYVDSGCSEEAPEPDLGVYEKTPPVQIVDSLPAGLHAVSIEGIAGKGVENRRGGVNCVLASLTCTYVGSLPGYMQFEVRVGVVVERASTGAVNRASVSSGDAPGASVARPVVFGGSPTPFGVEDYELGFEEEGGSLDTQAGSHPFQFTTTLQFNREIEERHVTEPGEHQPNVPAPAGLPKDLSFRLPAGLVGNPVPIPQCTLGQFLAPRIVGGVAHESENECPPQTAVGVAMVTVNLPNLNVSTFTEPLFNLEPTFGEPARFGFLVEGLTPVYIDASIRAGEDYGITAHVYNIAQIAGFMASSVTFWGVPSDPRHNAQRGWDCLGEALNGGSGGPCKPLEENNPPPFMTLPTSCTEPFQSSMTADSWAQPQSVLSFGASEPLETLDGCNRLPFTPQVRVTPDGTAGSTPTGLTVDEHVPQESLLVGKGLAESDVKGLSVTLPEGVAINPAGADGLQACSLGEIGLQSAEASSCPDAAKIATVKVNVPLLSEPVEGAAYLAEQTQNPFGSLVAMYIFAENRREGVRIKAAGEVVENPVTGQLTAHFEHDKLFETDPQSSQYLPQDPFEDVELHFFGGDRAPLVTPARCGSYTTTGTFTPWTETATAESSSTFNITTGPNGGPCPGASLPFDPSLTAGATSIQAAGLTPFTMTMSREDGSQTLQGILLHMPPGLSGLLTGVKLCGEQQADEGSCGPESLIGETTVSVGEGGDPFTVKGGKVYLTGPYRGAPFGLSIVNPAKAGPFDLGQVVVRARIEVNPETAALTITTDNEGPYKIPTILDGIPLEIKHVNVLVNRPGFTFNPTNCSPLAVTGTLQSTEGASDALSVPFQVTNCAVLAFKPKLEASTSGKTSRANGASFAVKLGYPAGPYDANIAKVKVELPKALPSRLTTLQKACKATVFEANPASCPAASIVGHAKATTPELPVPLSGPAYFVSHGGEAFPSLVIVLQGYGVTIHLVGSTFINKQGITSSTFKTVPDAPVGSFELTLPEGPYSALAANADLCKKKLAMPTEFVGQNGALIKTTTKITVTGCAKHKAKHTKKHAGHGRKRKKR